MLDWVAAQCVGYEVLRIPYLVDAMQRTLHSTQITEPSTYPLTIKDVVRTDFKRLPYASKLGRRLTSIPGGLRSLAGSLIRLRPIYHTKRCIACSACIAICPAKALELDTTRGANVIRIDDSRCITCFCCHEVCPARAYSIGRAPLRIAHRKGGLNYGADKHRTLSLFWRKIGFRAH